MPERATDLPSGGIARVQNASHAVRRLQAERERTVGIAIEA